MEDIEKFKTVKYAIGSSIDILRPIDNLKE